MFVKLLFQATTRHRLLRYFVFVKLLFLAGSPANPPGCADAEPQVNTCVLENVLTFIVHISSNRKETKIPTRISMQKLRGHNYQKRYAGETIMLFFF